MVIFMEQTAIRVPDYLGGTLTDPREKLRCLISHYGGVAISNEEPKAVATGLDIKPNDKVLSIAGSGDQVFHMLELGAKVRVCDKDLIQIEVVRARAEALHERDIEAFLGLGEYGLLYDKDYVERRRAFFKQGNRLETIRRNLDNLVLLDQPSDILVEAQKGPQTKINLSNVFSWEYNGEVGMGNRVRNTLRKIAKHLDKRGLIYVSNHSVLNGANNYSGYSKEFDDFNPPFLPLSLEVDGGLTVKARLLQSRGDSRWVPGVYRRVSPGINLLRKMKIA